MSTPQTRSPAGSSTGSPTGTLAGALAVGDPAADAVRRRGLRQMRTIAVGLLLLAAVVYLLTRDQDGAWGYVNAAAEASMVGAIADWFAVTALFKHPLGLPVPHTALIPKRKDELGRGLEEFVGENFLQESVIRERIATAGPSARLGEWLGEEANARRVVQEVSDVASIGLRKVRDEDVEALVTDALVPRFREEPIAPLLGGLLGEALRDDLHHGLVDLALDELHGWLVENPDTVAEVIGERAPWWTPPRLNDAVIGRIHVELVRWVDDIRTDPFHRARQALDDVLGDLARDLLTEPETQERAERLKERLLDHPQVIATAVSLWKALRNALAASLDDPDGAVRARLLLELSRFGERLEQEEELRTRLDGMVADGAVFVIERYGAELTGIITSTIARWDGREAARRIELHVGRDLQFIRINGTLVGGLVGLLIHALAEVLP